MHKAKIVLLSTAVVVVAALGLGLGSNYSKWVMQPASAYVPAPQNNVQVVPASIVNVKPAAVSSKPEAVNAQQGNAANPERAADLEALAALKDKAAKELSKPGWIHFSYQVVSENAPDSNGRLSNGQVIPVNYTADGWFRLNEEGLVFESVSLMIDEKGQVGQVGIFRDGVGRNLPTNDERAKDPFELFFDFGFTRDAIQAKAEKSEVVQKDAVLDGKSALLYIVRNNYSEPRKFVMFDQLLTGIEKQAYFEVATGRLLKLSTIVTLADGTEQIDSEVRSIVIETDQTPPDSILDYLQKEIVK